jgi:hypothetical protein
VPVTGVQQEAAEQAEAEQAAAQQAVERDAEEAWLADPQPAHASSGPLPPPPQPGQDQDWSGLDDIVHDLNQDPVVQQQLTDQREELLPREEAWTYDEARQYANKQAREYREEAGLQGRVVQAGHTAAPRHAAPGAKDESADDSGIREEHLDLQKMQQLHSRLSDIPPLPSDDHGLNVYVKDDAGDVSVRTRHTSQEGLINDAVDRAHAAQGGLTPAGQLDAADEVRWRTENVPMDQRDVEFVRGTSATGAPAFAPARPQPDALSPSEEDWLEDVPATPQPAAGPAPADGDQQPQQFPEPEMAEDDDWTPDEE